MVGVDSGSLYRRTHSLSRLAWSLVGGRWRRSTFIKWTEWTLALALLSQWLCHDDSTIDIVLELLLLLLLFLAVDLVN